jgi:radical SAM superfamily enzyme YgiQ (UPF0313 family)
MLNHTPLDVAFMFPPSGDRSSFEHHLGVAYIQSVLHLNDVTTKQILPENGCTLKECVKQLISTRAQTIGLTCYDSNYFMVKTIASMLKHEKPNITIIAGGPTATYSDELLLAKNRDIDICVRFEGEQTALELVSHLLDDASIDGLYDIEGITFRDNGSLVKTPDRPLYGSDSIARWALDGLPSPYLEGIFSGTEGAGVLSARGCPNYCTFCSCGAMSKHTIRYHSPDRVLSELHQIHDSMEKATPEALHKRVVRFHDDGFTYNLKHAKDICQRIIDEEIKLTLACLCRVDNLDEELIELLSRAGFMELSFGLESAVPRILRNIKKVSTRSATHVDNYLPERRFLSKVKKGISLAKRNGMFTSLSIIFGLPGETFEDGQETLRFVDNLNVDYYSHNLLSISPGTELFETAKDYGIEVEETESISIYPYTTKHAYAVKALSFGKNALAHEIMRKNFLTILLALAGGQDFAFGKGITSSVIEFGAETDFTNTFIWLSNNLSIGGKVIILGMGGFDINDIKNMRSASICAALPTNRLFFLKSSDDNVAKVTFKSLEDNPDLLAFPISVVKLSEYQGYMERRSINVLDGNPIYDIENKSDLQMLCALSDTSASSTSESHVSYLDGAVLDGCRWCRDLCPALELKRVVIDKDGNIRSCLRGRDLGTLDDSLECLRKKANDIYGRLRLKRGCDKCPADARCSKCLYPNPLSSEEYCQLRRNKPEIADLVIQSKLINTFDLAAEE